MKTTGQITYEAYAENTGWKSAISGARLPPWDGQIEAVKAAWEAAAKAARAYIQPPRPVIPYDPTRAYLIDELLWSATARCECGSGLAYHKDAGEIMEGAWRCGAAMMRALPEPDPKHGTHALLPFHMYEIKSEEQPSAGGKNTRPQAVL